MRTPLRLVRMATILLRYRLDDVVEDTHLYRPLKWLRPFLPRARADLRGLPRGARLRLAFTEMGPIFVKAGQMLSTRRDLIPADIADELAQLQDQVPPFPGAKARAIVEQALGAPVAKLFVHFDETPLASASIAQVHAATLEDGNEVVVKVLRPGIDKRIDRDVSLLRAFGRLAQRWHPHADKIRPLDVVEEIDKTLHYELDLQREGANASLLRRNFEHTRDLVVPRVYWSHSNEHVLTLERVYGVPADDIAAIDKAGIDRRRLAEMGVRLFYEQVFRDNFFHADAHPGNIWVDVAHGTTPCFIALDFGIMGSLPDEDQYWLAENFIALFERNYRRIAELHLAAGWMPKHIRVDELEAAVRTVCEPYFTRPLSEISLAEVVAKLFATAQRFELTIQPQLILLQKTLLNIEGVGRTLDPEIDIWAVAYPVLKRILRERYRPRRVLATLRRQVPEWLHMAPSMPGLVHQLLEETVHGQTEVNFSSADLLQLHAEARHIRRLLAGGLLGSTLIFGAILLWALAPRVGIWPPIALAAVGFVSFASAWPRGR
ncbi:MAG TPA: ubiquinone biosynthesis regulatory protein kinase UbiB [Rhodanobacteraceae bacterium]